MLFVKKISIVAILFLLSGAVSAQNNGDVQVGEFGFSVGAAHYFGDLNSRAAIKRPKPAVGIFFRKQFGNYIGLRVSAHYAQVGFADKYSKNEFQKLRNLSFNSNIWELAIQGDFNFFKFVPNDPNYLFTPYVTLGVGAFSFDPYAYLGGNKEYLRPLGTEGQNANYEGRKQYSTMALCIPFGVGIKYNISPKVNVSFEVSNRFTSTDYLDDVSTTYAGPANFPNNAAGLPSTAMLLQDRAYEVNKAYQFQAGQQSGISKQKDSYVIAEIGISFNISTYKCPSAF